MKKKQILKFVGIVIGVLFLVIQFYQPKRENPPVDQTQIIDVQLQVPDSVSTILKRSCYDCHSNETTWPFYSYIAPVSWLVSYDVIEGRKELNFSEWGKYKMKRQGRKLSEIASEIESGEMPMPKYTLVHHGAKLSEPEKTLLISWSKNEYKKMMGNADVD